MHVIWKIFQLLVRAMAMRTGVITNSDPLISVPALNKNCLSQGAALFTFCHQHTGLILCMVLRKGYHFLRLRFEKQLQDNLYGSISYAAILESLAAPFGPFLRDLVLSTRRRASIALWMIVPRTLVLRVPISSVLMLVFRLSFRLLLNSSRLLSISASVMSVADPNRLNVV